MKPLSQTNPYLRNEKDLRRRLAASTLDSCAFEGYRPERKTQASRSPRTKLSAKKAASKSSSRQ
jgi:hypothetical protein